MQTVYDSRFQKKTAIFMSISIFVIFSIYSFALTTLQVKINTDINFMLPVLIDIIPYVTLLTEVAGILIAYACIIFSAFRFDKKYARFLSVIFIILTLYKYIAKLAAAIITDGALPTTDTMIALVLRSLSIPALLEIAMLAVVWGIIYMINKPLAAHIRAQKKLERLMDGFTFDEVALYFPLKKLFSRENPLQRSAFYTSIMIMFSKMIQLVIVDIEEGLPANLVEFFWIITAYSLCVILGFASYLFMLNLFLYLHKRDIKLKYEIPNKKTPL